MTERRAPMESLAETMDSCPEELKKFKIKVSIKEKIAHLFADKDVMANSRAPRDLIADLEEDKWHIKLITTRMESLAETMDSCPQDAMEYKLLGEQLKKFKIMASNKEKFVRAFADKDVEKIYVYQ